MNICLQTWQLCTWVEKALKGEKAAKQFTLAMRKKKRQQSSLPWRLCERRKGNKGL
ncbi:hypothetical protein ACHQM5_030248 [Ranunculus cassubicifolius]